ncbi:MAG: PAS domain S-box protein [Bacteroidota bacterium]
MPKIGTKLGAGIATLLILCVAIGIVSYTQTLEVAARIEEITQFKEPLNSAVYGVENNLVETAFAALGYLSTGDPTLRESFSKNVQNFELSQQRFREAARQSSDWDLWLSLRQRFDRFHALAAEQITLKDLQAQNIQALLRNLDAIDALLTGKIVPSITPDDPLAYRRLQAALEMEVNVNAVTKGLGDFFITGESRFEKRIRIAEREFRRYFQVYQVVLLSSEEARWTGELRQLSEESLGLARIILEQQKETMEKLTTFIGVYRELGALLNERLKPRTETSLAQAKEDVLQAGRAANTRILFVLLLGVAFGIAAGVITTKNITTPLHRLVTAMNAVARGDHAQRIEVRSNDELRDLGDAFNVMTGQLVQAGEQLQESELRFRTLFRDAPVGIALADQDGRIIQTNPALQEMFGHTEQDLATMTLDTLVPALHNESGAALAEVREGARRRMNAELTVRRRHGLHSWVNLNISRMQLDRSRTPLHIVMMEDISARRAAEEQLEAAEQRRLADLRRFAESVQRAQEEERTRISRELHDDLCQRLSGIKLRAEAFAEDIPTGSRGMSREIRSFTKELDHAITSVRRISSNLRPSALDDFGLVSALRMLCKEVGTTHRVSASFHLADSPPAELDPEIEIALYRIAQEALSNTVRHAGATLATVRLGRTGSALQLVVADDGAGFDPESATARRGRGEGLGLISMRERAELLGGECTIDSAPGRGTTVLVSIPLEAHARNEEDKNPDS